VIEHEGDKQPNGDLASKTSLENSEGKSFYEKIWERDHPEEVKKEIAETKKKEILARSDKLEKQAKLLSEKAKAEAAKV
jgi:hypothetical protein